MPRRGDALLRRSLARARSGRGHRHERQDDDGVPAPRDPRGGWPPAAACSRTSSGASAASRARPGLTRPEAIDLQRLLRADGSTRATVPACSRRPRGAGAGPARRHALRGARLHEPDPGSPRLPRHDGGVLRGQGGARSLRPTQAVVNVGDAYGARLARRAAGCDRLRRATPAPSTGIELQAARPLQPGERDRRRAGCASARASTTTRSGAGSSRYAACRAGSRRSTRASPSR